MNKSIFVLVFAAYTGMEVTGLVRSELVRLRELCKEYCRGPYDNDGIRIGVALRIEGTTDPRLPIGIRAEPFANGQIGANVYVKQADWQSPPALFRISLWANVSKAIWLCVEKLQRKKVAFDVDKLRKDLFVVEEQFLGADAHSQQLDSNIAGYAIAPGAEVNDDEQRIVIQYRRNDQVDPWDFDRKVAFENLLTESLGVGDLGFCDSIDFDFDTINAICSVTDAKKATMTIIQALRANGCLDGAVIEETVKGKRKVVWPRGFVGGIEYI